MAHILIIDDEILVCRIICETSKYLGHKASYVGTLREGLEMLHDSAFDVVFLDVGLPDGCGLKALPDIHNQPSDPEVIIITGDGDEDDAEHAITSGAWDYVLKPLSVRNISLPLTRALQYRSERTTQPPARILDREGIVGESPKMKVCLQRLAEAAYSNANVLITGKTGTGKEVFAKAIHRNSGRAKKRMVVVDCAALPDNLVESLLFGHKKGAFTGADTSQEGLIKQADGGTLYLDEVGELPLQLQKAFLRVLQEHRFRPIGEKTEIESDFRLITATNRDLDKMVKQKRFRDDLLFRLKTLTLEMPPLRERPEDIKDILFYYIPRICERDGISIKGLSPEFLETVMTYPWPGNVRELVNTLELVLNRARHDHTLFPTHLPTKIRIYAARQYVAEAHTILQKPDLKTTPGNRFPTYREFKTSSLETVEKRYLQDLLLVSDRNLKEALRISKLSRTRFYDLLRKYKLSIQQAE